MCENEDGYGASHFYFTSFHHSLYFLLHTNDMMIKLLSAPSSLLFCLSASLCKWTTSYLLFLVLAWLARFQLLPSFFTVPLITPSLIYSSPSQCSYSITSCISLTFILNLTISLSHFTSIYFSLPTFILF